MIQALEKIHARDWKYLFVHVLFIAVPLVFGHPQIIVGAIVNFLLIYVAMNFKNRSILPAVFLPSMSALAGGVLFGTFTYYLLVFAPFIWISNAVFILAIRYFHEKKWNNVFGFLLSAVFKVVILFSVALICVYLFKFPSVFLQAMGVLQIGTALIAGVFYLAFDRMVHF